jgi:hypothetical protein
MLSVLSSSRIHSLNLIYIVLGINKENLRVNYIFCFTKKCGNFSGIAPPLWPRHVPKGKVKVTWGGGGGGGEWGGRGEGVNGGVGGGGDWPEIRPGIGDSLFTLMILGPQSLPK